MNEHQRRARRTRRRKRRGWIARIPAIAFTRKYPPKWKLKSITRRHHERERYDEHE